MNQQNFIRLVAAAIAIILLPSIALANVGVPIILAAMILPSDFILAAVSTPIIFFIMMTSMVVALTSLVLTEAIMIKSVLGVGYKQAMKSSAMTNLVSTLIATPIAWALFVSLRDTSEHGIAVVLGEFLAATWQLYWMAHIAIIVLLVLLFLALWWIEYLIIRRMNPQIDHKIIKSACLIANVGSYFLIMVRPLNQYVVWPILTHIFH